MMERFIKDIDEKGYWRIKDIHTDQTTNVWDSKACEWLNNLNKANNIIYLLEKYLFYDSTDIILISNDYNKVKKLFTQLVNESRSGYGYIITKYTLNTEYNHPGNEREYLDWIEIDDGEYRNLMELNTQ